MQSKTTKSKLRSKQKHTSSETPKAARSARSASSETKQSKVIAMLQTPKGTTIAALVKATGWQPHSVRGFFAGIIRKKLGLNLVSDVSSGDRLYRITSSAQQTKQPTSENRAVRKKTPVQRATKALPVPAGHA